MNTDNAEAKLQQAEQFESLSASRAAQAPARLSIRVIRGDTARQAVNSSLTTPFLPSGEWSELVKRSRWVIRDWAESGSTENPDFAVALLIITTDNQLPRTLLNQPRIQPTVEQWETIVLKAKAAIMTWMFPKMRVRVEDPQPFFADQYASNQGLPHKRVQIPAISEVAAPCWGKGENQNEEVLASFVKYCKAYPSQRFWQALRNWSGYLFLLTSDVQAAFHPGDTRDTFYWPGRTSDSTIREKLR